MIIISCEGEPWHVDPSVQRAYIASKCFERMGDLLKYNICNIPSSSVLNSYVPDIDNRVTRCIPPFLKYICCNWIYHLQDVSYSQNLCSKLGSFVSKQLLFWFEVLSLTSTFNDHIGPALLFAIQWVGVSASSCLERLVANLLFRTMIRNYHLSLEMLISRQAYIRSRSRKVYFRSIPHYYL